MLKRLGVFVSTVAVLSLAFLFGTAPPAAAFGNGVEVGQFAYVFENDAWLDHICNDAVVKPEFVVLNIDNGRSNDVAHLEDIAQDCMANGVKTLGYVHAVDVFDDDSDMNTTELRTRVQVGTDMDRWIKPDNPERTVGGQIVDGIFIDQVPNTCGAANFNTLRVADYTDAAQDKFTFWSYGAALVVANVGTAVEDCMPGFQAYADMPDRWVTYEGDYDAYEAGWLGGNVYSSGPSYYNGESVFGSDFFVHIVYDTADASEMANALRIADKRGAAWLFATDDVLANPYDTEPAYFDATMVQAQVPNLIFEDVEDIATVNLGGGNPTFYSFHLNAGNATQVMMDVAEDECGVGPTDSEWGTIGDSVDTLVGNSSTYSWTVTWADPLDSDFVTCMQNEWFLTGEPNNSAISVCNDITAGPTVTDPDCMATDGDSTTENLNESSSDELRESMDPEDVELLMVLVRDQNIENTNDGSGSFCYSVNLNRCLNRPFPQGAQVPNCITIAFNSATETLLNGRHVSWDPICW
jgi:hypothetical protein